jgi:hypothetical protein
MKSGRFFIFLVFLLIGGSFPVSNAVAFWGFGEEKGESGLDFEHGYDLNTVTTVKGKVISVESADGSGPVTITMARGKEIIHAVAAPKWFWFDRGISIKPGDELKVVGAKAQGKDGEMYVISREIANITSGEEAVIRDKSGRPAWKGGGRMGRGSGGGMQRGFGGGRRGR